MGFFRRPETAPQQKRQFRPAGLLGAHTGRVFSRRHFLSRTACEHCTIFGFFSRQVLPTVFLKRTEFRAETSGICDNGIREQFFSEDPRRRHRAAFFTPRPPDMASFPQRNAFRRGF